MTAKRGYFLRGKWIDPNKMATAEHEAIGEPTTSLATVLRENEIVSVKPTHLLITAKAKANDEIRLVEARKRDGSAFNELGTTSQSQYMAFARDEYNPKLYGEKAFEVYDKMYRSDGQIRSTLILAKTPILGANWYSQPATKRELDRNVARFVWQNLSDWMTYSFVQFLNDALVSLKNGFAVMEKVYTYGDRPGGITGEVPGNKGLVIWQKFATRHPLDIEEWVWDANGGPVGIKFYTGEYGEKTVFVPIDKLLIFSYDMEIGNFKGLSVLRSAYKHWYFKDNMYKIDAIQKERHGIGIPVIKLPTNFNDADKTKADELGRNLRTNESAHVVLPPGWELLFAKVEGQPVDALKSIEHHDMMLARNILAPFINEVTSGATQEDKQLMFLMASRYIATGVQEVVNKYAIPQLINFNWDRVNYPKIRVRHMGEQNEWKNFAATLRSLIEAQVIFPDDELEVWMREQLEMPQADTSSKRDTAKVKMAPSSNPEQVTPGGIDKTGDITQRKGQNSGPGKSGAV